jgi:hypothetical protein
MKDEKPEDSDLDPQTQADQLEERLIDFAVRIIKLSNPIAKDSCWQAHLRTNSALWDISSAELR